ncbi:MAG: hypothetical protein A2Z34_09945 [Planctomycetes bacterium RBG_16_59_8]|nr:MAG: hypothetical protein A2Z34_09945 [Planctomycetes bacterium RBG_16_59_8]
MDRGITISPTSQVGSHARVTVKLDAAGEISHLAVEIEDLGGFERSCHGRPVEEMPNLAVSLCSGNPWSHHLASAKACDEIFGVVPPPAGIKLRELCHNISSCGKFINDLSHAGNETILIAAEDPFIRNIPGLLRANQEIGKKVVHVRHLGERMLQTIAGNASHPAAAVPGGFFRSLNESDRRKLLPMASEILEFARFTARWVRDALIPEPVENVPSGYLGTVDEEGGFNTYDGLLRLMKPDGSYAAFPPELYADHIAEIRGPDFSVPYHYAKSWGEPFTLDIEHPRGVYQTNAVARLMVADRLPTPLAQEEFEEVQHRAGKEGRASTFSHRARFIELLYHAERIVELLNDPAIVDREVRAPVKPRAARGVGCIECSGGLLVHDYETDANGLLRRVKLITGTMQNNALISLTLRRIAQPMISRGKCHRGLAGRIETALASFDPCLPCVTHGPLPIQITILDAGGSPISTCTN